MGNLKLILEVKNNQLKGAFAISKDASISDLSCAIAQLELTKAECLKRIVKIKKETGKTFRREF